MQSFVFLDSVYASQQLFSNLYLFDNLVTFSVGAPLYFWKNWQIFYQQSAAVIVIFSVIQLLCNHNLM
jgi:MFS superfamily sulfate permease-like transporter